MSDPMAAAAAATPSSPFEAEDQTDEDFFNKLEDDDDDAAGIDFRAAESEPAARFARAFSNLSIDDLTESGSGEDDQIGILQPDEAPKNQDLAPSDPVVSGGQANEVEIAHVESTVEDEQVGSTTEGGSADAEAIRVSSPVEKSGGGSKVTSVKVVQWSAFSINDSEQFDDGGFGLDSGSDLLTDNSLATASNLNTKFGQEFGFGAATDDFDANIGSAEQQGAAISNEAANSQVTDVNDNQYWENLYPGWKFDSSTGQWCQIDGYVATTGNTQSETYNNAASGGLQDVFHGNLQGAGSGFSADLQSEVSYYQQTTQPTVGTVTEDYTSNNVSNWSQVSQGATEYPPNMVFDPQYPGWYYDTNTQQWQSLESYHQTLQMASDTVQDHSNAPSGFKMKENTGSYNGAVQYGQNTIQGDYKQDATEGWSMGNYVQPKSRHSEPINQSSLGFSNTVTVSEQSNASNGFVANENTGSYNGAAQYEQNTNQGHNNQDAARVWSMGNYVQPRTWLPESVDQSTLGSSNTETMQEKSNASNGFAVKENTNLYDGKVQYEQSTAQIHGNHNGGAGWSMGNYVQPSTWLTESVNQTAAGFSSTDTVQSPSNASTGSFRKENNGIYNGALQYDQITTQDLSNQDKGRAWSTGNYVQRKTWLSEPVNQSTVQFSSNQHMGNFSGSMGHSANHTGQQKGLDASLPFPDHGYDNTTYSTGFPSFVPAENMYQYHQSTPDQSQYGHYGNQNSKGYYQQPLQNTSVPYSQFSSAHNGGRSSAGRPPHALVTFGFGGKLIVMKDASSFGTQLDYGSQDTAGGPVSILNLMEVVTDKIQNSGITTSSCDYFRALCNGSFPGPLVGGSAATKDVNKWIDEKIVNCEAHTTDLRKGKLLLSLLKISCQHYGKLQSPFGDDQSLEDSDGPESAITKLFASARENSARLREYNSSIMHCMHGLPSEEQIRRTAIEVQNLLVSGRRKEALSCAQAGQLWGPALVLAAQLGEKFYVDTVKQMAHRQLVSGSPLKTLCLLIAGQPADVFSADNSNSSGLSYGANVQQPAEIPTNAMLDDWEENLAIITANRTKDDELVIIHLGDCLWRERGEITAAHTCYLVAEANFESYSDSARLCLIGADHWKCPRTYASPEAIQRTELYEYSKVLGNSQFILLQFQPYKLIYAYMLAEVGKVTDSLRYCQASLKLLKSSARSPEVEMWKLLLSSLEERIRTHQQGGFSTNLAPAKFVGKLITSIDKSIHRIMGAPTPSLPPMPPSSVNGKENHSVVPKVANSQSTMAMSSLIPSPSVESINEWPGDTSRKNMHNRSVSEPDFGRSPKQTPENKLPVIQDQLKDVSTSDAQSKTSSSGGPSRFGRIGSQLIQKTMGWVSISRSDHQAKLGHTNKFYYDERLKRWVEEGAEPPAEEPALQPPPTMASFQNGTSNYNIESSFKTQNLAVHEGPEMKSPPPTEYSSGIPNSSPSPNHFSVRSAAGIRSRYVDTFNKGGGAPMKSFQSPATTSAKPLSGAKFFVPATPAASDEHIANSTGESIREADSNGESSAAIANNGMFSTPPPSVHSIHEAGANVEGSAPVANNGPFSSPPPTMHYSREAGANGEGSTPIANNGLFSSSPPTMHRFPSMDNITSSSTMGQRTTPQNIGGSFSSRSRAASWSGSVGAVLDSKEARPNTLGNGLGGTTPSMPGNSLDLHRGTPLQVIGGTLGDDLHEVEL